MKSKNNVTIIKLKNLFFKNDSKKSLSQKMIHGSIWVFLISISGKLLSFVRLLIVARMLAPQEFGLMGIALLTIASIECFSQLGFQEALIQKKGKIKSYLNSAWTFSILRGSAVFIILYLIAPSIAIFFNTPTSIPIIRVIGLSILFKSFTNIAVVYFRKELEFNKQYVYQLSGALMDFVVTIIAALILKNVWALILGLLAGDMTRCFVSYFIHSYKPRITKNFKRALSLFGFSKWVIGANILIFLLNQGDDMFVGKFLSVAALGFYQLAYKISNLPATNITHVISKVSFPTYSKLQNNLPKLKKSFLLILQFTTFLSIPLAGIIIVFAPDFIKIFLGQKWMPMLISMQILAIWGAIRSIGATSGGLFYGAGRPDIVTKLTMAKLIVLALLIYPLTKVWGISGTALAVVIASLFSIPIVSYIVVKKIIKCKIWDFCKQIVYPLIATLAMMLTILLIKIELSTINIFNFFILVITSILIYMISILVIDHFLEYNIKDMVRKLPIITDFASWLRIQGDMRRKRK